VTEVAFIGGFGRSGSTLLERVIAELPGVCALGEVLHLWKRGVRDNELCACGEPFDRCPFWNAVGEEAFGGWHNVNVNAIIRMRNDVDRTRHIPSDVLHGRLSARHARAREYAAYFARVYAAAAKVSGARIVLDSSKNASTAFALRAHEDIALRVVHVVRDSRGVAYSWTKRVTRPEATVSGENPWMPQYTPGVSAVLWDVHNLAFSALGRSGVPVQRIHYEQFLADPNGCLGRIAAFLGMPTDHKGDLVTGDIVRLRPTHQVAGNPMRFRTGDLQLRSDEQWRVELSFAQASLVGVLTAPLMLSYGYGRAPGVGQVAQP
jgi:sulfotransferase family protein